MLASTVFVLAHFAVDAAARRARRARRRSTRCRSRWRSSRRWCRPGSIAEAIRRIGANATSLVGSLGPVFTIALGAWLLAEPVHPIQLVGAALVLAGVALVTLRPPQSSAVGVGYPDGLRRPSPSAQREA